MSSPSYPRAWASVAGYEGNRNRKVMFLSCKICLERCTWAFTGSEGKLTQPPKGLTVSVSSLPGASHLEHKGTVCCIQYGLCLADWETEYAHLASPLTVCYSMGFTPRPSSVSVDKTLLFRYIFHSNNLAENCNEAHDQPGLVFITFQTFSCAM